MTVCNQTLVVRTPVVEMFGYSEKEGNSNEPGSNAQQDRPCF